MSSLPFNSQANSFLTVSTKREALWNVQQPGDPYDIRKSMIAKVPGDKKNFMGDYLEIVCLFQAAQIQRLCQFLDDFKLRYRQIQRRQLDRHSYEVQIKELTHKLAEESGFRQQNQKLREFIKNQSSNRAEVQDSVKSKYEKLLLQFKSFEDENTKLKRDNQTLSFQISSFDAKYEALKKSKDSQIEDMYLKMSQQQSSMSSQFQLSSLKSQYESQIQRLDLQNKRIKQQSQTQNRQFSVLQEKYSQLEQQLLRKSPRNSDLAKYERQVAEYENRFVIFGQEIDRLNLVIKEITGKYELTEQRNRQNENRLQMVTREYEMMQGKLKGKQSESPDLMRRVSELELENTRLKQSDKSLQEYESRLKAASEQISRLTNQLRIQTEASFRLKSDVQRYEYESSRFKLLQKQLSDLKQSASENNMLKMQLAENENRVAILKQEITRLQEEIFKKGSDDENYRRLVSEYQKLQRQYSELDRAKQIQAQDYERRIQQKVSQYESRIQTINRTKGTQFESRVQMLQTELQRISVLLRSKSEQSESYLKQIRDLQYTITNKYELQGTRKVQNYESIIQNLRSENQNTFRKLKELQPLTRRVAEYENRIAMLGQEMERLGQGIRQKDTQIENLRRQVREQQIAITQKYEIDASRKISTYQMNINQLNSNMTALSRQNEEIRRKYQQIQNKAALLSQEVQRLTVNLRQTTLKNSQYEQQLNRLQRVNKDTEISITQKYEYEIQTKINNYENAIRTANRQNDELRRKIVEYENAMKQMSLELDRLSGGLRKSQDDNVQLDNRNKNLGKEFEELNRRYAELQATVRNKFEVQATRTITTLEQTVTEHKRYLQEYENRLKAAGQDIENLSMQLRNALQENEMLKKQLKDINDQVKNKLQVQVVNKYRSYEGSIEQMKQNIELLTRQNNELKRVLQVNEQNNIRLNQENEELRKRFQTDMGEVGKRINDYETFISQLKQENQTLRKKIKELEITIHEKYEIEASRRISSLDQNLNNMARQNEQLKRRLEQTLREFEQLRRVAQNMERDNEELGRRLRQTSQTGGKRISENENKISFLAQQLEHVTQAFKAKSQDFGRAQVYIKQLTTKLQSYEQNLTQSHQSIQQYEVEVKQRIQQYEQAIQQLSLQNNELKKRLPVMDDMNSRIAQYENKIVIMNQELERVNGNLKGQVEKGNQQENVIRNLTRENEELKRNIVEIQQTITQRYEVEATRNIRTLEQAVDSLQKENQQLKKVLHEYEQNLNNQNAQLQKLAANLRALTEENNLLKNQVRQTEISITRKYETQVTSKYNAYESGIANLKRQNQDLVRKIREYGERVVPQYESETHRLAQQLERLNNIFKQESGQLSNNLKSLRQQNDALKRQIIELQQNITQKYEVETTKKFSSYEQNISLLQKENQDMKRYIKQAVGKYETEVQGLGQNTIILQKQNEDLKRALQQLTFRYESQNKKAGTYEQNLTGLGRENEDLKRRINDMQQEMERLIKKLNELSQENESIRRQAKQGEIQITQKYQSQTTQQINVYKQQIVQVETQWKRQVEELTRRLNDLGGDAQRKLTWYEEQMKRSVAEIEKLNLKIREYDAKMREISADNEKILRQARQNELTVTQKWQSEFKNRLMAYEQTIQSLNKTAQQREKQLYDVNNKRIMDLEGKAVLLSQQLQRLNQILKLKTEENQKMRLQIERLNNTLRLKLEETKQYQTQITKLRSVTQSQFTQLQTTYTMVVKQNENLKKNLYDYEGSIKKLYVQFERLQTIINDLKKERESLFEKNYALSNEIQRLTGANKDLEVQVQDVRLRLSDEAALHKRINEHMALMVVLFAEIESLRKRVKDKEKQVEDVRRSSLAPFKLESRARIDSV